MSHIAPVDLPPLSFSLAQGSQKYNVQSAKIGWLRTMSDKPGASFDLTIKDSLGRVRMERQGCKTETTEYGELLNMPTMIGENLEIEISNLKGAEKLTMFLN